MKLSEKITKKKKEQMRAKKAKKAKIAATGAVAGIIAGAVGGVLLAPKSGKETRRSIKKASRHAADAVSSKASATREKAGDVLGSKKERVKEYLEERKSSDDA